MLKSQIGRFSLLVGLFIWAMMIPRVQAAEIQQNFRDVEIANVIEAVAKVTGQNFIIDPRVRGKVTLIAPQAMSGDALYQTLLAILNVHGFVAIPSGEVIKVVPVNLARDQLPYVSPQDVGEAWVTEVVSVNHVEAAKLVAILRPLVAREGHLVALADSNRLIVTDTVDGLNRIKAILRQIDINTHAEFEVIRPQHAPADELVRTLRAVQGVSGAGQNVLGARINFDERSNRIIVSGDIDDRLMVRALIADLDVPLSRDGSIQVVYLQYAKATDLVPILQQLASQEGFRGGLESVAGESATSEDASSRPANQVSFEKSMMTSVSIQADERMNAIVMSAPADILEGLKSVIRQLDIRRAQVLIEAIIVELSEARAAQLGVDWAAFGASGVGLFNLSGNLPGVATAVGTGNIQALPDGFPGRGVTAAVGEVRGNSGWGALINALRSDTGANILSTPTLLTLDNESAEIIVGREVPFRTGSFTTSAGGTNPFTTIERKSVGLKLRVKPQINQGNEVYLEIENEISDVLPGDTPDLLQTSKRELRTSVIVGDGDTIVLGGLLSERETDTRNEVPGLGSIPGLGALFRNQSSQREKVNLMIFLRPVIIRDQTMGSFHSRQKYGQMQEQQQTILRHSPSGLLEGLRPELPTLEQLDDGLATSSEKGVISTMPRRDSVIEQSTSSSSRAVERRDSSLEVLGF
ncbi:type II secretion system secretin GspD [Thiomicrospira cyclica]|uniref:General secretion pathway protein D n=1 Tax=Thiomicrospira cyclica (strain DSM 14477 / JCM 11371 / ALM1) TaxID=717773 RepID=F6DD37_THICA|nr:type II secretion system secretin GspD [Thiomicrospira cyclica]AEG31773.1 general secretion pathway protein D [Thiomicrospira cyclica ALM1]